MVIRLFCKFVPTEVWPEDAGTGRLPLFRVSLSFCSRRNMLTTSGCHNGWPVRIIFSHPFSLSVYSLVGIKYPTFGYGTGMLSPGTFEKFCSTAVASLVHGPNINGLKLWWRST